MWPAEDKQAKLMSAHKIQVGVGTCSPGVYSSTTRTICFPLHELLEHSDCKPKGPD